MVSRWDKLHTFAEISARQLYWRSPRLVSFYHHQQKKEAVSLRVFRPDALNTRLDEIGVKRGALVMVHSSLDGMTLRTDQGDVENSLAVASQVLQTLMSQVGDAGTLLMPTHPHYPDDPGFMHDKRDLLLEYDVQRTRSRVGLLPEIFRRRPGVLRSLHPLSSLAASGPLSNAMLQNNLNDRKPLPHGVDSGYYRFCQRDGLVVSIGLPLIKCITVLHVAEEVRDHLWPVKDFFYDRRFVVHTENGNREEVTVRERRPHFVRSLGLAQVRRDLLREGILHETLVDDMRIDWACAGSLFKYMMCRNQSSPYPYWATRIATLW